MSIAILGIKFGDNDNSITLENGTLRYIDSITSEFKDEEDLKNSEYCREKVNAYASVRDNHNGKITLTYIRNNKEKVDLDLIFDEEEIRTRTSSLEEVKSETEKARKLLLNSKNQIFLTSFLLNKNLAPTTSATVKMTINEYRIAKNEGYKVTAQDGEYRISIKDVLKYRLTHQKLGPMRLLVEDTLEVWKKNMLSLKDEDLYFYSRELRLLLNEYDVRKFPRKLIGNLKADKERLDKNLIIKRKNNFTIVSTVGLPKRKILEDRKAV